MQHSPRRRMMEVVVIDGIGSMPSSRRFPGLEDWVLLGLSGHVETASYAGAYKLGDLPPSSVQLVDLARGTGEWMAILRSGADNGDFMIMSDYFGFGRVHYAIVSSRAHPGRSTLIAGLTQRGVLSELGKRGLSTGEVNWDVALPHLVSNVALFRTRSSDRTFSSGIQVLPRKSAIVAGRSGVGILDRPEPLLDDLDYDTLIERGIEGMVEDSKAALVGAERRTFSLSGGRDSRALMAVFAAGGIADDLEVVSDRSTAIGASGEVFRRDLELASKMVDRYGLDWKVSGNGVAVPATFQEVLDDTLDSRANEVFEISPRASLVEQKNEVSFMGMGGEYYRSYIGAGYKAGFPLWWNRAFGTPDRSREDLASLFEHLVKDARIPADFYVSAQNSFVNSMSIVQGGVIDQLEYSFDEYRSRAHAGNVEWMRVGGTRTLYPLARPEFEAASAMLNAHDYSNGRVIFDIIEKADSDLNALPLEAKPWPEDFRSEGNVGIWEVASAERANEKYHDQKNLALTQEVRRRSIPTFDFDRLAVERVGYNVDSWRGRLPDAWHGALIERVARLAAKNEASVRSLLIVTESIQDVYMPPDIPVRVLEGDALSGDVSVSLYSPRREPVPQNSLEVAPWTFSDEVAKVDLSGVRARMSRTDTEGRLVVELEDLPRSCESAIYVYAGGSMLTRTAYLQESRHLFEGIPQDVAVNRATIFLRWSGDVDATRVFDVPLNEDA
ncbi:hypothetical protein V1260_07905 [Brachybacterium sp. J144]|uniref:hypothetical protein n=1 Tax=Brachybacterium sp. J144 TaxID=3116487 RepID=UPI002E77A560|nr:hypothetical protein [Brachybacterium sp. J144]MEE1650716.1 hypothetical protein [Brachybacterium sp. J144]